MPLPCTLCPPGVAHATSGVRVRSQRLLYAQTATDQVRPAPPARQRDVKCICDFVRARTCTVHVYCGLQNNRSEDGETIPERPRKDGTKSFQNRCKPFQIQCHLFCLVLLESSLLTQKLKHKRYSRIRPVRSRSTGGPKVTHTSGHTEVLQWARANGCPEVSGNYRSPGRKHCLAFYNIQ